MKRVRACLDEFRLYKQKLELVISLERDFGKQAILLGQEGLDTGTEPAWLGDKDGSRLMSLGDPLAGTGRLLIVIDGPGLLASMRRDREFSAAFPEEFRLTAAADPLGQSLGPDFPGLKIVFPADGTGSPAGAWSFRRSFYLLAMALVIALTLFGAYLLWRDVRRDLQLAEMRSQFVASVSHELKTPLTAIRMFAETLRLRRSSDPAVREEYLDTIVKESERLTPPAEQRPRLLQDRAGKQGLPARPRLIGRDHSGNDPGPGISPEAAGIRAEPGDAKTASRTSASTGTVSSRP